MGLKHTFESIAGIEIKCRRVIDCQMRRATQSRRRYGIVCGYISINHIRARPLCAKHSNRLVLVGAV